MILTIRKLSDDDGLLNVDIAVSADGFAAHQDSYVYDAEWLDFSKELQSFPQTVEQEVIFESGSREPNCYCFIRLRAFVHDGVGHSALEVEMENHLRAPYSAAVHFHVLCEPALLNELGQQLERWVYSKSEHFVFPIDAA